MTDTFRKIGVAAFARALGTDCRNTQDQIIALLRIDHHASVETIADWLYGGDASGGPEDADGCIKVLICRLRKRGFSITVEYGRGYALERPA